MRRRRRSPRSRPPASTSRRWRTTTASTSGRSASSIRSPRSGDTAFPVVGIGRDADAGVRAVPPTVHGQRIAIIGATQVLDDALIPHMDRDRRPTAGSRRRRTSTASSRRCCRRAPTATRSSCSCTGARRARPARRRPSATARRTARRRRRRHRRRQPRAPPLGGGRLGAAFVDYGLGNFAFYTHGRARPRDRRAARDGDRPPHRSVRMACRRLINGGVPRPLERRRGRHGARAMAGPAQLHRPRTLRSLHSRDGRLRRMARERTDTDARLRRVRAVPRERRRVRHPLDAARRRSRRVEVAVGGGQTISALRVGRRARPSSCSCTAARRTRTPGTRSPSRSTARWSRSTSPATGTPSHRDDHVYWPADNAVAVEHAVRDARARRRASSSACRSAGSPSIALADRAPDLVRSLVLVDVTPGREPREVDGDRAVHRRARVLRELRRDPRTHDRVQPDAHRVVAAARRPAQRDRAAGRPVALALRPSPPRHRVKARAAAIMPGLDELWDAVVTRRRCR